MLWVGDNREQYISEKFKPKQNILGKLSVMQPKFGQRGTYSSQPGISRYRPEIPDLDVIFILYGYGPQDGVICVLPTFISDFIRCMCYLHLLPSKHEVKLVKLLHICDALQQNGEHVAWAHFAVWATGSWHRGEKWLICQFWDFLYVTSLSSVTSM